ncbi:hypothetical protein NDK47_23980 [Brevibacillus ruminantium]|uniref:Uncharacterized protein n=1 Tax=Brevibacillus ruminantium TaxID=2950604 RepID=A0ABY4WDA8_9BACL|nr:hypothetical protein [Brevibacillus ruminantium]USG65145.1 hypothetical protein NDK47_23980 [Brevibacillus ruminantium]
MSNYGTVNFEGKTYKLTGEADFTNRLLEGRYKNYTDASEGDKYDAEFSAPAVDNEGNEVTVYWMFEFVKGDEPELDSLNWKDVARIV